MALDRVLEPEVMDTPEAAREYDQMDHGDVNRIFVDDFLAAGGGQGDILDLGTGTALIPIELCQRSDQCRVMAADLSANMLDLARLRIEIAGLIDRIQLAQLDGKHLPQPAAYFDQIMSNSIVHHLPDPSLALAEALRVTRPGGLLFFRDLFRPATEEALGQLVERHAAGANEHQQRLFADSLRAALTVEEMQQIVSGLGFPADGVRATSDRHWTWCATVDGDPPERVLA